MACFAALALVLGGCSSAGHEYRSVRLVSAHGPAFGLTEDNADLLWNPLAPARSGGEAFQAARQQLTALHPSYVRLLVDWAALAPSAQGAPVLEGPVDGCARSVAPCGAYAGVRAELAAIASQQRRGGDFQVVVDVLDAPAWAVTAAHGCSLDGADAGARPLRADAIAGYRELIRSLLALAREEGVSLPWWSPWNEPNDPHFIDPQHASCAAGAPPVSVQVYAELARAMAAELRQDGGEHHLLIGELNNLQRDSPHTTSVASFVAALPEDVACLAGAWSIHAYAALAGPAVGSDGASGLERALDARGGCARGAPVWITEAGAGAAHPGRARIAGAAQETAGCQALAAQLQAWSGDPRVAVVLQYTFREDPAFPVGLVSADLEHVYPAYRLWLSYARRRAAGEGPPSPLQACG